MKKTLSLLTLLSTSILFSSVTFAGEAPIVADKDNNTAPTVTIDKNTKDNQIVAKYNNLPIRAYEIQDKLRGHFSNGSSFNDLSPDEQNAIVKEYVDLKLIEIEAKKAGIENEEGYKKKLKEALAHYNTILKEIPIILMRSEFMEKKKADFQPNEKDIKKEYDRLVAKPAEEVKVSHILVKTAQEAKDLLTEIKAGKSFEDLAKDKSLDTSNKDKGGELGYFGRDGQMAKAFEEESFKLKKDGISGVVKTDFGFHIIKLLDRRKKELPSFEQLQPTIQRDLMHKAVIAYVDKLEKQARVDILIKKAKKN
jgi:parvulin-like peptidyl-prolyl isomerase